MAFATSTTSTSETPSDQTSTTEAAAKDQPQRITIRMKSPNFAWLSDQG